VLVDSGGEELVVACVAPSDVSISGGSNMAGEPRETVEFDVPLDRTRHALATGGVDEGALRIRGALSRVLLMAGAAEAVADMTVDYTHSRVQFGRPIAHFQAVQLHLVRVAQHAAQLSVAADIAVDAFRYANPSVDVATAKVIASDVAENSARAAHQAHGAMGMTREYPLHLFTRRLWSWRFEYGTAREWSILLGQMAFSADPDDLFSLVADSPFLPTD
jgi:acyl-CoA dehydrogenase